MENQRTQEELISALIDAGYEGTILLDETYASAFIGVSHNDRAAYSYTKMIECLAGGGELSYEDAIDHIEHNAINSVRALEGKYPIIIYDYFDV